MKAVSIIDAVSKLIDVKSLVTIALTIGFIWQACCKTLTNDYMSVYLVVISFYFGTQYQKGASNESTANSDIYRSEQQEL